jgi:hypothetical protein
MPSAGPTELIIPEPLWSKNCEELMKIIRSDWTIVGILLFSSLASLCVWTASESSTQVSAIASIAVAAATLMLALFTYRTIIESREQSSHNRRSLERPILIPSTLPNLDDLVNAKERYIDIKNSGRGVATNIWGLLSPYTDPGNSVPTPLSMRFPFPLPAGDTVQTLFQIGGTIINRADLIGEHSLFVLPGKGPMQDITDLGDRQERSAARLTLTYHDIFGSKHAAIFDMTTQGKYRFIATLDNISMDITDIHASNINIKKC